MKLPKDLFAVSETFVQPDFCYSRSPKRRLRSISWWSWWVVVYRFSVACDRLCLSCALWFLSICH